MSPEIQTGLWISHPILEVAVVATLYGRKRHTTFPIFFSYLAAQVVMFCILFPVQKMGSSSAYFYTFWIFCGISLVLGFKVIYEIFVDVFRPFHALKDLGAVLFKWAGLVMLLAAVVIAAASPHSGLGSVTDALMITQRGVRIIHCGLILFLLIFARHLGVSWKQNSFGIALGFGLYSAVELGTYALYSSGRMGESLASSLVAGAYFLTMGVWLTYASFKTFPRVIDANLLAPQRWNQSLADVHHPAEDGSLIPMFEGMVERAFSRSPGKTYMTNYAAENPIRSLYSNDRTAPLIRSHWS
jgi:hypothetical protein